MRYLNARKACADSAVGRTMPVTLACERKSHSGVARSYSIQTASGATSLVRAMIIAVSSRKIYQQARRVRILTGAILLAGIIAIMVVAYTYSPS